VNWYKVGHHRSGIRYVSPAQSHAGKGHAILAAPHDQYTRCRELILARWSGKTQSFNHANLY
jgi:putative transposase